MNITTYPLLPSCARVKAGQQLHYHAVYFMRWGGIITIMLVFCVDKIVQ